MSDNTPILEERDENQDELEEDGLDDEAVESDRVFSSLLLKRLKKLIVVSDQVYCDEDICIHFYYKFE